MSKPVVRYRYKPGHVVRIGAGVYVYPIDHPDTKNVSNTKMVLTSRVVALHPDGFETENTRYVQRVPGLE